MKKLTLCFIAIICATLNTYADTPEGVEMVDLGLPSGTMWANMNLGATAPEQDGDKFMWGETTPVTSGSTYFDPKYTKYKGTATLKPEDDAAHVNWGEPWRIPTPWELEELRSKCSWTKTQLNGKDGYIVTGPNQNSIFMPLGWHYWSYKLADSKQAMFMAVEADRVKVYNTAGAGWPRDFGLYVRPVCMGIPDTTTYVVTFKNDDGTVLQSTRVKIGGTPAYKGATPTKAEDTEMLYTFAGWTPALAAVFADATYTATYKSTQKRNNPPANVQMVDLGLPSGLKWANMNIGATAPEDYGYYIAWYDLDPKDYYDNHTGCGNVPKPTNHTLDVDAARINWGAPWYEPTFTDMVELVNNCTWTWTTQNEANGYLVTGKNGNSIFLPAGGFRYNLSNKPIMDRTNGYYWTSTHQTSEKAKCLKFNSSSKNVDGDDRYYGMFIRPVCMYDDTSISTSTKSCMTNRPAARKFMHQGHFYIDIDDQLYNATGARVK